MSLTMGREIATASTQPRTLFGLSLGIRTPQGGVAARDAACDVIADELGDDAVGSLSSFAGQADADVHFAASSAAATVSRSSFQETTNFSTPSFSRSSVTSSYEIPNASSASSVAFAES